MKEDRIKSSKSSPPIEVQLQLLLQVDNCYVQFEIDNGAAKCLMSQQIFN